VTKRDGIPVEGNGGRRFVLKCRSCHAPWTEEHPRDEAPTRLARDHHCAGFDTLCVAGGSWQAILLMGIRVLPVVWHPGHEHPCSPVCSAAAGAECRCACKGAQHGVALLPAAAISKAELDALYDRLDSSARFRKGDPIDRSNPFPRKGGNR
jgi:hypothetical protein